MGAPDIRLLFVSTKRYSEDMYQTIHEEIAVAGVYSGGRFVVRKFVWRSKTYQVKETTLVVDTKDGGVLKKYFGMVVTQEKSESVCRLLFAVAAQRWWLEELWVE